MSAGAGGVLRELSSGVISGGGLQSVAGYLGLALVLGWGGGGRVWSLCFGALLLVLAEFLFCRGAVHWAIILWGLDTFLIFPKIICLKSFGNSYMPCL